MRNFKKCAEIKNKEGKKSNKEKEGRRKSKRRMKRKRKRVKRTLISRAINIMMKNGRKKYNLKRISDASRSR